MKLKGKLTAKATARRASGPVGGRLDSIFSLGGGVISRGSLWDYRESVEQNLEMVHWPGLYAEGGIGDNSSARLVNAKEDCYVPCAQVP